MSKRFHDYLERAYLEQQPAEEQKKTGSMQVEVGRRSEPVDINTGAGGKGKEVKVSFDDFMNGMSGGRPLPLLSKVRDEMLAKAKKDGFKGSDTEIMLQAFGIKKMPPWDYSKAGMNVQIVFDGEKARLAEPTAKPTEMSGQQKKEAERKMARVAGAQNVGEPGQKWTQKFASVK